MRDKNFYVLIFLFVCVFSFSLSIAISERVVFDAKNSMANVINFTENERDFWVESANFYTISTESMAKRLNNPLISLFRKKDYERRLNDFLFLRKQFVLKAISEGASLDKIYNLHSSVPEYLGVDSVSIDHRFFMQEGELDTSSAISTEGGDEYYTYTVTLGGREYNFKPFIDLGYASGKVLIKEGVAFGDELYISNTGFEFNGQGLESQNTVEITE